MSLLPSSRQDVAMCIKQYNQLQMFFFGQNEAVYNLWFAYNQACHGLRRLHDGSSSTQFCYQAILAPILIISDLVVSTLFLLELNVICK